MIAAGPLFGKYIANKIHIGVPEYMQLDEEEKEWDKELPSFGLVATIILIPLVLILLNTLSTVIFPEGNTVREIMMFIGNPIVALIFATILTFIVLGTKRGYTRREVQEIASKSLEPVGIIVLVTGAGGALAEVLISSGVADILGEQMAGSPLPPVLLAFLIAAVVRIAQGSATVSMVTAAGLMAPVLPALGVEGPALALIVIAIAGGATAFSHVNDSGFWLVSRYFGLEEKDTLKSWTVMETIIGLVGLAVALLFGFFLI